jgi:hypothetical protein
MTDADDEELLDPEEAERRITEFISTADQLPGVPVAELTDRIAELMRTTSDSLETILADVPHNKVLASHLLLSQRARSLPPDDPEQWRLYAASTLVSGMIIPSAEE